MQPIGKVYIALPGAGICPHWGSMEVYLGQKYKEAV